MTLTVDWTRCDARGMCLELLPELLTPDPWGYPLTRPEAADGRGGVVVPEHLTDYAERAVAACPLLALKPHYASNKTK